MKSFGAVLEFTRERNDALLRAYRIQLRKAHYIVMADIFQKVADSPAPRFWVSEERAAIVISAMVAGRPLPPMRECKRQMFQEIYARYLQARSHDPDTPLSLLVADIVNQPAPHFYLTPRTIAQLIYHINKNNRKYEKQ